MVVNGAPSSGEAAGANSSWSVILLCCAAEDRFALAPAVERLAHTSVEVEIISGVEYDPTRLAAAIQRHKDKALYVLCRSDRLDRFKLTRLQLMLKREGLADEQVLPVKVLAERPESVSNPILERIRQAPAPVRASAPPQPPPAADADDPDDDAATVPVRLRDILEKENEVAARAAAAPSAAPPPPAPAAAPPPPAPAAAPVSPPAAPLGGDLGGDSGGDLGRDLGGDLGGDDLDDELAAFGQRKRLTMIVAGFAAVGLLAIGGALLFGGDDEAATEVASAPDTPAPAETAPAEPRPEPEPAEPTPAPAETGAAEEPAPEAEPEPEPEPEPAPAPEPADAPPTPEPGTFDLTPAEEHAAMMEALRSRRVRAFDLIVFVPKVSRYGNVARAQKYCAEMEVEGLKGWRLPSASELRALLEADLINRARYWTNQSRGPKKHVMIEGRSRRAATKKTSYKGGRALCVRDEAHETDGE